MITFAPLFDSHNLKTGIMEENLRTFTIPEGVTTVPSGKYIYNGPMQTIRIPRSVTTIESEAFGVWCHELRAFSVDAANPAFCDVDGVLCSKDRTRLIRMPRGWASDSYAVPEGVTEIGEGAFRDCCGLTHIQLPPSVTAIGSGAFHGCKKLERIDLPPSLKRIENQAFWGCSSIREIVIPDGADLDYPEVFCCNKLERINIPSSVTEFPVTALFIPCPNLRYIDQAEGEGVSTYSVDGVLFTKDKKRLVGVPPKKEPDTYTIPASVEVVGKWAFQWNSSLRQIVIPHSVRQLEDWAFGACKNLTEIVIPSSVTEIGFKVFDFCRSLRAIRVEAGNPAYCDIDGVLFSRDGTRLIKMPEGKPIRKYTLPDSVVRIESTAFRWCDTLEEVVIPDSVRAIGSEAFSSCDNLQAITIGRSVVEVGMDFLEECFALRRICCLNPRPDSIKIYNCDSNADDDLGENVYFATLFVPAAAMEAYRSHPEFGKFRHIEPLPEE